MNEKQTKVILFGGRLSEAKGGNLAIEALALVVKKEPNTVLVVAGKIDDYAKVMKQKARDLGIEKHLVFTGWLERDEMKQQNKLADIVLVPSAYLDPFPRTVIEAMACGKPVVGTIYGGMSELIIDGVTGYVVDPFNVQEIADRLIDLLSNAEKRKEFGDAGLARIKEDFNLKDKVQLHLNVYEQLLYEYENRSKVQVIKDWVRLRTLDILTFPVVVFITLFIYPLMWFEKKLP